MFFRHYLILFAILLLLTIPIKYFVKFNRRKRRLLKYVSHLPAAKGLPIIGIGIQFVGKNTKQIMKESLEFVNSLKTPFYCWFGANLCLILSDPVDVEIVLNSKDCIDKAKAYKFFYRNGLFTAPGHIWRPQRKILNSAFNLKILQSFIPIFNEKSDLLVRNVGRMVGKGYFNVTPIMFACTLDMVSSTTLGTNVHVQNGENHDYLEAMENFLSTTLKRMINVFYQSDFIYKLTKLSKIERKYAETTERLPQKIIDVKQQKFLNDNESLDAHQVIDDENDANDYNAPQIFIEQLFRLHKTGVIDDRTIKDQVNLMLLGGTDTSALSSSHILLMLAMHPDIQNRVLEEINEVYADVPLASGSCSTYEQIRKLIYLEKVMKESMRLLPIAPFLLRHCSADTKIQSCTIPKSATIIIAAYHIHRDPEIWGPNANEFDPEHFDPEQMNARRQRAFLAFSRGPRDCIGMRYAFISMKILLVALLRRYKFSTYLKMEDLTMKYEIMLKIAGGDVVQVEERYPDLLLGGEKD